MYDFDNDGLITKNDIGIMVKKLTGLSDETGMLRHHPNRDLTGMSDAYHRTNVVTKDHEGQTNDEYVNMTLSSISLFTSKFNFQYAKYFFIKNSRLL